MDAPLASKRLNWYGGVGTLYSYNRSFVSLSYTSIDPFILPSNKAKSIPALIMVVVSHFRSGLGFCTTEKLLINSPLYKNWSPCGPYKVRERYGGMFWLPETPNPALSFKSLKVFWSCIKPSSDILQAAETAGNMAQRLLTPNFDDPSVLKVALKIYFPSKL